MMSESVSSLLSLSIFPYELPTSCANMSLHFQDFFNVWSRVGCEFDSEKYTVVIDQISQYVQRICEFIPEASDLIFAQDYQLYSLNYWLDIQSHTCRLHNAISSIWPRDCLSHAHHAKMRLTIPTEDYEEHDTPIVNVSFAMDKRIGLTKHNLWEWRDVKVISCQQQKRVQ